MKHRNCNTYMVWYITWEKDPYGVWLCILVEFFAPFSENYRSYSPEITDNPFPEAYFQFLLFSTKYIRCDNSLDKVLLMSNHNICFRGEIRKPSMLFSWKKRGFFPGPKSLYLYITNMKKLDMCPKFTNAPAICSLLIRQHLFSKYSIWSVIHYDPLHYPGHDSGATLAQS